MTPTKPIRVVYFTDKQEHATKLYRVWYPSQIMEHYDLIVASYFHRFQMTNSGPMQQAMKDCDIFFTNQILNSEALKGIKYMKRQGKKIIYDMDDLYFDLPSDAAFHPTREQLDACIETIRIADAVTVVSPYLGKMIGKYAGVGPEKIHYIPNMIPYGVNNRLKTEHRPTEPNKKVVIGMMGAPNHIVDWKDIMPVLREIKAKYKNKVQFETLGLTPEAMDNILKKPEVPGIFKEYVMILGKDMEDLKFKYNKGVKLEDFFATLCSTGWDIGLATLTNNRTDKSKSFLKYLDYSMAGICGVYRGISPFTDAVMDGRTGMMANSHKEWVQAISYLVDNPDRRIDMLTSARYDIKQNYDIGKNYTQWLSVFNSVVKRS